MNAPSKNTATVFREYCDTNRISYDTVAVAKMETYCEEPATPLLDREPNTMLRGLLHDLTAERRNIPAHEQRFHEVQIDRLRACEPPRQNARHAAYEMFAFHLAGREAPPELKPLRERIDALARELQLTVEYRPEFDTILFCARGPWRH